VLGLTKASRWGQPGSQAGGLGGGLGWGVFLLGLKGLRGRASSLGYQPSLSLPCLLLVGHATLPGQNPAYMVPSNHIATDRGSRSSARPWVTVLLAGTPGEGLLSLACWPYLGLQLPGALTVQAYPALSQLDGDCGEPGIRLVLKHEPRSLTCMLVI